MKMAKNPSLVVKFIEPTYVSRLFERSKGSTLHAPKLLETPENCMAQPD